MRALTYLNTLRKPAKIKAYDLINIHIERWSKVGLVRCTKCPIFLMNINNLIHIGLISFIALFVLSHDGNRNQQEGCVDVDSGTLKHCGGALMWGGGTLMLACNCLKNRHEY